MKTADLLEEFKGLIFEIELSLNAIEKDIRVAEALRSKMRRDLDDLRTTARTLERYHD